jgi:hypothetical protein
VRPFTLPSKLGGLRATHGAWPSGFIALGLLAFLLVSTTACTDRGGHSETIRSEPDDTLRARYERTAIGLGCISFRPGSDEFLRAEADQFLKSMGFTLDTYVQTSLSQHDPAMSERIFAAILACGRTAGEDLDATPPSAP